MRARLFLATIGLLVAGALGAGCGGGDDDRVTISAFEAHPAAVQAGGTVRLTAHFRGGSGRIDPGVGAVDSGVPVDVTVLDDTEYTLSVSGQGETVSATVGVSVVYDTRWEFDDGAGWVLQGAAPEGGALALRASISAEPGPAVPPVQGCSGSRASASWGDAKLAAGRYTRLSVALLGVTTSGLFTGRRMTLRYHGRQWVVDLTAVTAAESRPASILFEWTSSGGARLYVDGVLAGELPSSATADPDGIELSMVLCPRPFPEPGGSATWRIDAISASAR